ncbi:MAG: hypothetical protein JNK82_35590 [Myxococcaceae bacterium]|nr:hypothetical protein [Myxococcaceae bacterium]
MNPRWVVLLSASFCGCFGSVSFDGGTANGGGSASSGCQTDDDCAAVLEFAAAQPPGCASAKCVVAIGMCQLSTRDDDGDGERAAKCTGMLPISRGPDCDDSPGLGASINTHAAEVCDGEARDENCNGTVDEGCACPDLGAVLACCSGRGAQTCEASDGGGAMLTMCTAPVSRELCNGVDDDCNEAVDDHAELTPDGGVHALDGGVVLLDGGCVVGVGACARAGAGRCVAGEVGCSVVAGAPADEVCNALDDDCDGETDEPGAGLCAVTGQLCTAGTCGCPAGQSVCGTACAGVGSTCTAGVGACERSGAVACNAGSASCTAVAGTPGTETCNGSDDDCDGQSDEGLTITCLADGDNDRYATSMTTSQRCPDAARAAFGNCPDGFVSPAASLGIDCAAANASAWRTVALYPDADNDGYCTGGSSPSCIGAAAPTGYRTSCTGSSDCAPSDGTRWVNGTVGVDADGDGYCTTTATQCYGSGYPAGYRAVASCQAMTDCAAGDVTRWRIVSAAADADYDQRCTSSGTICMGASFPTGYRDPASCLASTDCAPTDNARWVMAYIRVDNDNDGYCIGGQNECIGASPPAGWRTNCPSTDCKDNNPFATTTCFIDTGYETGWVPKSCGIGPPQCEHKPATNVERSCPPGWHPQGFVTYFESGTCSLVDPGTVNVCCSTTVFGEVACRVRADCVPD